MVHLLAYSKIHNMKVKLNGGLNSINQKCY
jgi:hypothetical protein